MSNDFYNTHPAAASHTNTNTWDEPIMGSEISALGQDRNAGGANNRPEDSLAA